MPFKPLSLFLHFSPITLTDLITIIKSVSSSSCLLDLSSPKIFNDLSSFFYPIILNININFSLAISNIPISFKSSIVTPIQKKPSFYLSIISNYHPISNLSFLSKILEKAIYLQLSNFFLSKNLLPPTQSGFRLFHSTETCFLKISNDALLASDYGKLSLLFSLNFFSAFDTVDHSLLLQHLNSSFGISGSSLSWLTSYLFNGFFTVSCNNSSSYPFSYTFGVPQGSVLGLLLYSLYLSSPSSNLSLFKVSFLLTTHISSFLFLSLPFLLLLKGLLSVSFLFFQKVTPCI